MRDMTYEQAIKNVAHLKALGDTEIWLKEGSEKPWKHVTTCEPGGSHRLDISTSVWFEAVDPETQLHFRWSFNIEPMSANGKENYEIDAAACRFVMQRLEGKAKKKFADYLTDCSNKVYAKAEEWKVITDKQFRDASILKALAEAHD